MDLKKFLLGLLLFIIPIILIILIYKFYIYKICHHNEQCIKKNLMYNLDDISNHLKNLVSKQEKEEQIEGFFSGIVDWFYPNPESIPGTEKVDASNIPQANTNPLQNNNLETSPLSGENKDSSNNEFLKSLSDKSKKFSDFSNTNIKSMSDIDNINKKLESELKNKVDDINTNNVNESNKKPTNFIEKNAKNDTIPLKYETNNPKNLYSPIKMEKEIPLRKENFNQQMLTEEENIGINNKNTNQSMLLNTGQCNFFHDVCPSDYSDLGNFSLGGMEKNITLNCGDVQNTKPAKAVAVIKNNEINDVLVVDKGQGFNPQKPPKVDVVGGGGRGAELEASIDDDGYLKIIKVIHPGYNYNETPNVIIESPMMNSSCHLCCKK